MRLSQKNSEHKNDFVIRQIKMISELNEAEIFLNKIISNNKIIKSQNFVLFVKEWLDNWKIIVNYEQLKYKCKKARNIKEIENEINDLFIKQNTKQKFEELGNMDCSVLKKRNITNRFYINESSNFIPIIDYQITSFSKYIQGIITIRGEVLSGKIYINNFIYGKDQEKRILVLYRENEQFKKYIITLEQQAKVNSLIKELKDINIEELLNKEEYKDEIFNKSKIKNIENEKEIELRIKDEEEEDEKKKRKEDEDNKKEEEKKINEEKERKRKEEAERKRLEEERKRKEEEKRRKEKEERQRKEEERRKREEE